jgi:hypothetical protein
VINTVAGPRLVQKDEAIASLSERVRVLEQARVKTSAELTAALEDLAQKDKEWAAKLKDAKEQTTQDIVAQEAASKDRLVKMHERYMRRPLGPHPKRWTIVNAVGGCSHHASAKRPRCCG